MFKTKSNGQLFAFLPLCYGAVATREFWGHRRLESYRTCQRKEDLERRSDSPWPVKWDRIVYALEMWCADKSRWRWLCWLHIKNQRRPACWQGGWQESSVHEQDSHPIPTFLNPDAPYEASLNFPSLESMIPCVSWENARSSHFLLPSYPGE